MSPSCWQGLGGKSSLEETGGRTSRSKAESTGTETDVSAGSREGMEDEGPARWTPIWKQGLVHQVSSESLWSDLLRVLIITKTPRDKEAGSQS